MTADRPRPWVIDPAHHDAACLGRGDPGTARRWSNARLRERYFVPLGKLFHCGLRYLEQFDDGLVREALYERELMLARIAPHLVRPVLPTPRPMTAASAAG